MSRTQLQTIGHKLRADFTLSSNRFRHALRAAIALAAAVAVVRSFDISHGVWFVITVLVVMKPNLGSSIRFGKDRLIGTICGVLSGLLVALLPGKSFIIWIIFPVAMFLWVYIKPFHHRLSITILSFAVVLAVTLFLPGGWKLGLARLADTTAGVIFGLLISWTVWPNKAVRQLATKEKNAALALGEFFRYLADSYLVGLFKEEDAETLRLKASPAIRRVQEALHEAELETGAANVQQTAAYVTRLRRLYDLLLSLEAVARRGPEGGPRQEAVACIRTACDSLYEAFGSFGGEGEFPELMTSFEELRAELKAMRRLEKEHDRSLEDVMNLSSFLWHLETLAFELQEAKEILRDK